MRYISFVAATVIAISPVNAQELAVFETWAPSRLQDRPLERGPGLSFTATAPLGGIMSRVSALRGSNVRVGARLAFSQSDSRVLDYSRCVDDCPADSWDLSVPLQVYQGSLLAYPYRTPSSQLELSTGLATYRYSGKPPSNSWGLTAGVGISRRLIRGAPLWASAAYEMRGPSFARRETADYVDAVPPRHAFRLGMAYAWSVGGR